MGRESAFIKGFNEKLAAEGGLVGTALNPVRRLATWYHTTRESPAYHMKRLAGIGLLGTGAAAYGMTHWPPNENGRVDTPGRMPTLGS